jgi:hypothetical protein
MLVHKIEYEESDHGGQCDSHASNITGDNFNYSLTKGCVSVKITAFLTILVSHWAEHSGSRIVMQLLASRDYPVIDNQTMDEFIGCEHLFRTTGGAFLLHMASKGKREAEERVIWLTVRDAISWLNEAPDEFGSFWECARVSPLRQKQIQHISPTGI